MWDREKDVLGTIPNDETFVVPISLHIAVCNISKSEEMRRLIAQRHVVVFLCNVGSIDWQMLIRIYAYQYGTSVCLRGGSLATTILLPEERNDNVHRSLCVDTWRGDYAGQSPQSSCPGE